MSRSKGAVLRFNHSRSYTFSASLSVLAVGLGQVDPFSDGDSLDAFEVQLNRFLVFKHWLSKAEQFLILFSDDLIRVCGLRLEAKGLFKITLPLFVY